MRPRIGIFLLTLLFFTGAAAQDFASEKKKLLAGFKELPKLAEAVHHNKAEYDSPDALNARLRKRLLAITSKYPNSLKVDSKDFDDAPLAIRTSPGGKFCVYAYDFQHLHDTYFKYD